MNTAFASLFSYLYRRGRARVIKEVYHHKKEK